MPTEIILFIIIMVDIQWTGLSVDLEMFCKYKLAEPSFDLSVNILYYSSEYVFRYYWNQRVIYYA